YRPAQVHAVAVGARPVAGPARLLFRPAHPVPDRAGRWNLVALRTRSAARGGSRSGAGAVPQASGRAVPGRGSARKRPLSRRRELGGWMWSPGHRNCDRPWTYWTHRLVERDKGSARAAGGYRVHARAPAWHWSPHLHAVGPSRCGGANCCVVAEARARGRFGSRSSRNRGHGLLFPRGRLQQPGPGGMARPALSTNSFAPPVAARGGHTDAADDLWAK